METLNDYRLADVPTPAFDLAYNGKAITADIAPFVLGITYTDHLSGESDELDVELEDSDGRWLDSWYPDKGAALTLTLGYLGAPLVSVGRFDIDEVGYQAPPSTVRIRALATGVQKAVRTRKGRAYEKTTLAAIAQRVAKAHKMTLVGKIEAIAIDRATQYHETDLAFLARLAGEYGYAFKVTENNSKLVFWKGADLHLAKAVRSYRPEQLISWQATDKLSGVPDTVKAKYHDPKKKVMLVATVKNGQTVLEPDTQSGASTSADTAKITRRAPTKQAAEAQARAHLDRRLLERTSMEITVEGDPVLAAGSVITLTDLGKLSGSYTITRATHRISRGDGYLTTLELKRVAPAAKAKRATKKPAAPKGMTVYGVKDGKVQAVGTTTKKK
ncbi:phage protein D [Vogesella perlucida]|nr:phage protein D [Vogesella perlucida]